jgi:flagellar basal body-associated protein FliL
MNKGSQLVLIVSAALFAICAGVFTLYKIRQEAAVPPIPSGYQDNALHLVPTADGAWNLGKIYSETRVAEIAITYPGENSLTATVADGQVSSIDDRITAYFKDTQDRFNQNSDGKSKIDYKTMSFNRSGGKLKISLAMEWKSENLGTTTIGLHETEVGGPENVSIHDFVRTAYQDELKNHSDAWSGISFLHPEKP